jgi:hypothetical protein
MLQLASLKSYLPPQCKCSLLLLVFLQIVEGILSVAELEFLKSLCGLGTKEEYGYRTARQATKAGGFHSLESIPELHKRLNIRALVLLRSSPAAGVPFVPDFVAGVPTIAPYYFVEQVK